jgi:hypothetical protein
MMRPFLRHLILFAAASSAALAEGERPLNAERAGVMAAGESQVEMGLEVSAGAHRVLFPDEEGTQLVLPRLGLRTGLGPWGEIRVEGNALVWFDPDGSDPVHDAGDWWIRTKVRLGPADRRLRWAAQAGVKVPVASDEDGLGTDEADVELLGIASFDLGPGRIDANLGVDILGRPESIGSQEDLLRYSAAYWWLPDRPLSVGAEIAGRSGGNFFPAEVMLRAGIRRDLGAWRVDVSAAAGLSSAAPSFELRAGATFRFARGGP